MDYLSFFSKTKPSILFNIAMLTLMISDQTLALGTSDEVGWHLEVSGSMSATQLSLITDVPAGDQGQYAQHFLAARLGESLFCFSSSWEPCGGSPAPYHMGDLPPRLEISLGTFELPILDGVQIIAGYGSDLDEMLAAERYRPVYSFGQASSISWQETSDVPYADNAQLAFNNTPLALRDWTDTLHIVWEDGNYGYHGWHDGSGWQSETLPKGTAGSFAKPTIGLLGDGELMVAWSEFYLGERSIFVTRTQDDHRRWESPLQLDAGDFDSPTALYAFAREDGSATAVVAWLDEATEQVKTRNWQGSQWSLDAWGTIQIPSGDDAKPHDVAIGGQGERVWLSWEDQRAGSQTRIYLARSIDGGESWEADYPLPLTPLGPVGGDPSIALLADGGLVVGYQNANRVFLTQGNAEGDSFMPARDLGEGLFVTVATNTRGGVMLAWERFTGSLFEDSGKQVGNTVSLDRLLTLNGPAQMPGSDELSAAIQASATISNNRIDVFWIDMSVTGVRQLKWRTGLLN